MHFIQCLVVKQYEKRKIEASALELASKNAEINLKNEVISDLMQDLLSLNASIEAAALVKVVKAFPWLLNKLKH